MDVAIQSYSSIRQGTSREGLPVEEDVACEDKDDPGGRQRARY